MTITTPEAVHLSSMMDEEGIEPISVEDKDSRIPLSQLPTPLQNYLRAIAIELLGPTSPSVALDGPPTSGKTFLLRHLPQALEQVCDNMDVAPFTDVIKIPERLILLADRYDDLPLPELIDLFLRHYHMTWESTLLVTHPLLATILHDHVPHCHVLSEIDSNRDEDDDDLSSALYDTVVFDTTNIHLTIPEMASVTYMMAAPFLSWDYHITINRPTVTRIMTEAMTAVSSVVPILDERATSVVPFGVWVSWFEGFVLRCSAAGASWRSTKRFVTYLDEKFGAPISENKLDIRDDSAKKNIPPELNGSIIIGPQEEEKERKLPTCQEDATVSYRFKDVLHLPDRLKACIFGQDEAIDTISRNLIPAAAGINDASKPLRSMILLGPTGVGKTKTVLTLAQELTETPMHMVRIDMSEYQHDFSVANLIGSPKGYVGSNEGGILTNEVAKYPHSVVLFDEVEKAHPKVWDILLQILDYGHLSDNGGHKVDFTHTVIAMTSNAGATAVHHSGFAPSSAGDDALYHHRVKESKAATMNAVKTMFRPEFLNRIDDVVVFSEMSHDVGRHVARHEIRLLAERVAQRDKKFTLEIPSDDVIDTILTKADVSTYGARDVQKVISRDLGDPVALSMVSAKTRGATFTFNLDRDGHLAMSSQPRTAHSSGKKRRRTNGSRSTSPSTSGKMRNHNE